MRIAVVAFCIALPGCMGGNFAYKNYESGKEMHAPVGGTMTSIEWGRYRSMEIEKIKAAGIRKDLLYSGKSGSTIRISYREFTFYNGYTIARPDFFKELTYDLSESDIITFEDMRIKVLSATNNEIVFEVLQ
jgi:hypothetical protein